MLLILVLSPYEWKGRRSKKKVDIMKQPRKPENRTSYKEIVHSGWRTQKETNPVETNQKTFFTSEHIRNLSTIPQEGTILSSLLLITDRESFFP